jgi:hypothetical protein
MYDKTTRAYTPLKGAEDTASLAKRELCSETASPKKLVYHFLRKVLDPLKNTL